MTYSVPATKFSGLVNRLEHHREIRPRSDSAQGLAHARAHYGGMPTDPIFDRDNLARIEVMLRAHELARTD